MMVAMQVLIAAPTAIPAIAPIGSEVCRVLSVDAAGAEPVAVAANWLPSVPSVLIPETEVVAVSTDEEDD